MVCGSAIGARQEPIFSSITRQHEYAMTVQARPDRARTRMNARSTSNTQQQLKWTSGESSKLKMK